MGGDHPRFDAPLPDLWDDERAAIPRRARPAALPLEPARRRPAHHQFRRRQHLGQGGGDRSADRRADEGALGQGLRRRHRLDEARRLRHALSGQASRPEARYRGLAHEDEMVALFDHCTFNLNPRAASIDTPLHGFVPHAHVDHVHADAVIAIAASENAEALTREIYRRRARLAALAAAGLRPRPEARRDGRSQSEDEGRRARRPRPVHLGPDREGLLRDDARDHQQGARWLGANARGEAFGGRASRLCPRAERRDVAAKLMPAIRKRISAGERKVGHFTDAPAVLEFVNSRELKPLAALGTSCPDHFLRTKIRPAGAAVRSGFAQSRRRDRLARRGRSPPIAPTTPPITSAASTPNSPAMRDPNPVVYLVPGVGMLTFAKDKATARIAAEFYVNAINVMRGASAVSRYVGLAEQEAFNIEYWLLEEAKLQRMPKPKSLAGRVALVTGGAGGIGRAIAAPPHGRRRLRRARRHRRAEPRGDGRRVRQAFGKDVVARRSCGRDQRARDRRRVPRGRSRLRRRRHRRRQRRHRLRGAVRGHFARALEPQHGDPRDRLFPRRRAPATGS